MGPRRSPWEVTDCPLTEGGGGLVAVRGGGALLAVLGCGLRPVGGGEDVLVGPPACGGLEGVWEGGCC